MLTAAAILIVLWPGHDIPPMSMTAEACRRAAFQMTAAAEDYRRQKADAVPGFKVWCKPDDRPPRLVS